MMVVRIWKTENLFQAGNQVLSEERPKSADRESNRHVFFISERFLLRKIQVTQAGLSVGSGHEGQQSEQDSEGGPRIFEGQD
ncbi:MAG: hypothetical protein V2J65_07680 [Desulfobacteraceae bacterium]|jgi:hypothetical protein|nr:hypothetical protein [Desulfobacteraceae bacterium]